MKRSGVDHTLRGRPAEKGVAVSSVPDLAAIAAIGDPVARRDAARRAAGVFAALCKGIERDAVVELVHLHQGNHSAAARELGVTHPTVLALIKGTAVDTASVTGEATTAVAIVEPALFFEDEADAEVHLRDWQLKREDLDTERDQLIRGALAVGADPTRISELTGVAIDTINRLRPVGNIPVTALRVSDLDLFDEFARGLHNHAQRLTDSATTPEDRVTAAIWEQAARVVLINCAPAALVEPLPVNRADYPDQDAYIDAVMDAPVLDLADASVAQADPFSVSAGPDAWLARTCVQYTRISLQPPSSGAEAREHDAASRAFADIAAAIRHLRRTGTVPDFSR